MNHPFQCIATINPSPPSHDGYLLAACGQKLISLRLSSGDIAGEWPANQGARSEIDEDADGERPAKKQKTNAQPSASPNIIKLAVSPQNDHFIAVTDDKAVRVFAIQEHGQLVELSQRIMPKRPCAIQVLPNRTILCGDKFGDVYSLPLLKSAQSTNGVDKTESASPVGTAQPFKPSATSLTVHTQRNLKSLESQLKQKNLTPKTREPLTFQHELLLGHVSMLTDLAYGTRVVGGKERHYIFTADRDEHIRVSRGPPQSYIIEGFCFGHTEYVSKLCLIPGTDVLLSGGGQDWIGAWDWPSFKPRKKIDIRALLEQHTDHSLSSTSVNVSGIWVVPAEIDGRPESAILVASERVPALAIVPIPALLSDQNDNQTVTVQRFDNPILDVTVASNTIFVSFDARNAGHTRLGVFQLRGPEPSMLRLEEDTNTRSQINIIDQINSALVSEKALDSMLYGVANLRKRAHEEEADEADADDDVVEV